MHMLFVYRKALAVHPTNRALFTNLWVCKAEYSFGGIRLIDLVTNEIKEKLNGIHTMQPSAWLKPLQKWTLGWCPSRTARSEAALGREGWTKITFLKGSASWSAPAQGCQWSTISLIQQLPDAPMKFITVDISVNNGLFWRDFLHHFY